MDMTAIEKIIIAGRTAKKADDILRKIGYTDTPYFNIYGNIADALYILLGEKTDTFDKSLTYKIMESETLTETQRAAISALACEK